MSKALSLLLQRELSPLVITEVREVGEMIRVLAKTSPNVLLLDWNLYGSPAPDTCRLLQKAYPHLKLVLLSADEENRVEAETAGASFIHRGAEPDELIRSLRVLLIEDLLQTEPSHLEARQSFQLQGALQR